MRNNVFKIITLVWLFMLTVALVQMNNGVSSDSSNISFSRNKLDAYETCMKYSTSFNKEQTCLKLLQK